MSIQLVAASAMALFVSVSGFAQEIAVYQLSKDAHLSEDEFRKLTQLDESRLRFAKRLLAADKKIASAPLFTATLRTLIAEFESEKLNGERVESVLNLDISLTALKRTFQQTHAAMAATSVLSRYIDLIVKEKRAPGQSTLKEAAFRFWLSNTELAQASKEALIFGFESVYPGLAKSCPLILPEMR